MKIDQAVRKLVCRHYPDVQAIYRFGSAGTEHERTDSDLDIALLLPPHSARHSGAR